MAIKKVSGPNDVEPHELSPKEYAFAKVLAANDKKTRDQGLYKLRKWLQIQSSKNYEFDEEELKKIWVGLHFSMWMSDKPLVQEDLAESLSNLIHCFGDNDEASLLFIKSFNVTLCEYWYGLDQHRIEKFSMLVRRFLRQSLVFCEKRGWNLVVVKRLMKIYSDQVLSQNTSLGLKLHFLNIFLEELAKVGRDELTSKITATILKPFIRILGSTNDGRVRTQLSAFFRQLIKQTDLALDYDERFRVWQEVGFRGDDISVIVPADDSEEGNATEDMDVDDDVTPACSRTALDPRAGSVDVALPQIEIPYANLIKFIKSQITRPEMNLKGRKMMLKLKTYLKQLMKGRYPLGITKLPKVKPFGENNLIDKCAESLLEAEEVNTTMTKLAFKRLKKRQAKRDRKEAQKLMNNGDNDIEEDHVQPETGTKRKRNKDSSDGASHEIEDSPPKKKRKSNVGEGSSETKRRKSISESDHEAEETKENTPDSPLPVCNESPKRKKKIGKTEASTSKEETTSPLQSKSEELKNIQRAKKISPTKTSPKSRESPKQPSPKSKDSPNQLTPLANKKMKVNGYDFELKGKSGAWMVETVDSNTPLKAPKDITLSSGPKDPWSEPLEEGEYEVFIPKRITPTPVFWDKAKSKVTPKSKHSSAVKALIDAARPSSGRRISFNLEKNCAQETQEYWEGIISSPKIPYDSEKKPLKSGLKPGLAPSPINPFYKKSRKF